MGNYILEEMEALLTEYLDLYFPSKRSLDENEIKQSELFFFFRLVLSFSA